MPKFSVVIPTYNRIETLPQALGSVWMQSFDDFEVIVVDDGSTDETAEYLSSVDGKIQVLRQSNRGPGAARNLGLQVAQGDYVAFLDSDDVWFPWSLEIYAEAVREHQSPSFIAGKPFRFEVQESLGSARQGPMMGTRFRDYLSSGDRWRWWGTSSFVIRRESLRKVGGFTEANINGEDADLALRLGEAEGFLQITSPVTFGYRDHPGSAMKGFTKTLEGAYFLISAESTSQYPGGAARKNERWRILTRHLRPVSVQCARHGRIGDAWRLYGAMFAWHLGLFRWKYLLGFPVVAAWLALRRSPGAAAR